MSIDRLFIAEKPSVAQSLADYFSRKSKLPLEKKSGYFKVGNDVFAPMSGHLLAQVDADVYDPRYKKWTLEDLPIIPSPFRLAVKPKTDKSDSPAKVETIRKLLEICKSVVGVGDPDQEGQLLQDQLLIHLKNRKPVMRLWVKAWNDATVATALASMRPNEQYVGWYESALSRSQADWLYGINMSRACALRAQEAGADFKITIGRVQTPTLALVVNRELELRNYTPVHYHVPFIGLRCAPAFRATWFAIQDSKTKQYDDLRVDAEGRLLDKADADAIVAGSKAAGVAHVIVANTVAGTESPPLPFSLSTLQSHCSKLYKLSVSQTLAVAQSLYLKKLTSYPRVDTCFLPENQHEEAPTILRSLTKTKLPAPMVQAMAGVRPDLKSKAWDDSKVTAHHAIIPAHLDNPADLAVLTEIELKVYLEIVKRYLLQFWPAAKVLNTELVLMCESRGKEELFTAKGKRYTDEGWRRAFAAETELGEGKDKDEPSALPQLKVGETLPISEAGITSKVSPKPKRFTDATLVTAMESVHQYVKNPDYKKRLKESVGIGTDATRASIITELQQKGFLTTQGQELVPSDGAMILIGALPDTMRMPDMTAMWQQLLGDVLERRMTHAEFISKLVPWLTTLIKRSEGFFSPEQFPNSKRRAAPVLTEHVCFGAIGSQGCGAPLKHLDGKFGPYYGCSNEGCRKIFRDVGGKPAEKGAPVELDKRYQCVKCNTGFLQKRPRKDQTGSFWTCSSWRDTKCDAMYNDLEDAPDLEGKSRGGGGSKGGGSSGPRATPYARPGSRGRPSTYRTPTPTPARN
jgi:DNA topoisomerase III